MLKTKDKAYGNVMFWGAALAIGGFIGAGILLTLGFLPFPQIIKTGAMGLAGVALLAFVAGLLLLLFTLLAGLGKINNRGKRVFQHNDVKVIARYSINGIGETIFDERYMDFEDPKIKFYVRLQQANGFSAEYHCNAIVWGHCAEMMTGTALIQGDWIGQFIPQFGDGQGDPYRPEMAAHLPQNL